MLIQAYEKLQFIKFTRAVLQGKETSMNTCLDAINYIKRHGLDTNEKALSHYYKLKTI